MRIVLDRSPLTFTFRFRRDVPSYSPQDDLPLKLALFEVDHTAPPPSRPREKHSGIPITGKVATKPQFIRPHNIAIDDDAQVYVVIMAITGHKTFATFQRCNNPTEEDVKAVVLANPPKKMIG